MQVRNSTISVLMDKARFLFLGITLFYTLCFQYVFFPINNFLLILGATLAVLEFFILYFELYGLTQYKPLLYVFLFILFSFSFGTIFAYDRQSHINLLFKIVQYCVPMLSVCGYARNLDKFCRLLKIISLSVFILSVALVLDGVAFTDYGAITVGDLNTNILSSYLMIGLLAELILLCNTATKVSSALLYLFIVVEFLAQMLSASRRGLVVFAFLLVGYVLAMFFIKYKKNSTVRAMIIIAFVIAVVLLAINFHALSDEFVIIQRFLGKYNAGDTLRTQYQNEAKKLFLNSPLVGQGFGCVAAVAGMYSHSMYYELLASNGVLGFSLLLLPLIFLALRFIRCAHLLKNVSLKMMSFIFFFGIFAILLSGIAVVGIFDMYFYILLGLIGAFLNVLSGKQVE